jgi:DNA-binding PadR family transcriptional regulator
MRSAPKPARSGLEVIHAFFARPAIQHLGLELAVCWVLERLLEADTYPTALMQDLAAAHPKLRLSETVLQQALTFLDQQGAISSYAQRCPSRGRPRRMLHLLEGSREQALGLMVPWHHWLEENELHLCVEAGSHATSSGLHAAAHGSAGCRPGVLPSGCQ